MQNSLIIAGAIVFLLFLLWKLRPQLTSGVSIVTDESLKKARERAKNAKTPRDKAEALCDASDIAAAISPDLLRSKAYLLRALRVDPSWPEPLRRAKRLFWRRDPAALEDLLWRLLANTPLDRDHEPMVREALALLVSLYTVRIRDGAKANALARIMERFSAPTQ